MGNFGIRNCVFCGKEFQAKSFKQNSCGDDHYSTCPICGDRLLIKESYVNYMKNLEANGPRCCVKCKSSKLKMRYANKSEAAKQAKEQKRRATMLQRYGAENSSNVPAIKAKIAATVKEKYGVDNLSQSAAIQAKIQENSMKRYGVNHYTNDPTIRKHMTDGMIAKYGVPVAQQNKEIRERTMQTCLAKYGVDNVYKVPEFQLKREASTEAKYGAKHSMQVPELRERALQTNLERYGAVNYIQSDAYLKDFITDGSKIEEYRKFIQDERNYISDNFVHMPTLRELGKHVGLSEDTIGERALRHHFTDMIAYHQSYMENEVIDYLRDMCPDVTIIRNTRSVISPMEIDIYLPDYKLGIECDPTVTHNSSFKDPWGGNPKPPSYHKRKNDLADAAGVQLFHIFGYEWTWNKDVIKSMLRSLLHKNERSIYARKCDVRLIDGNDCRWFLNENHRQGNADSSYRYGLYYQDELVSVMTFSKMRSTIGKKASNNDKTYELVRFCNLRNTNVVGGASKLFKHFLKEVNPSEVVSFSDRAHTTGKLYSILGFEVESYSDSGYVWVNYVNDSYYSRVACQKKNLRKLFNDDSIDIDSMTERQIMETHGYARVFDCGVIRWRYLNQHIENY